MVDVTDLAAVNSVLQNATDHINSFSILFAPYSFFNTLSTLIKTLSSSANILFIVTAYITHDVSAVGKWNFWQRLVKIENDINGTVKIYKV